MQMPVVCSIFKVDKAYRVTPPNNLRLLQGILENLDQLPRLFHCKLGRMHKRATRKRLAVARTNCLSLYIVMWNWNHAAQILLIRLAILLPISQLLRLFKVYPLVNIDEDCSLRSFLASYLTKIFPTWPGYYHFIFFSSVRQTQIPRAPHYQAIAPPSTLWTDPDSILALGISTSIYVQAKLQTSSARVSVTVTASSALSSPTFIPEDGQFCAPWFPFSVSRMISLSTFHPTAMQMLNETWSIVPSK